LKITKQQTARTIAIGDIHGCATALASLIEVIDPQQLDTIVTLGDYVDRGLDSKGVIEQMIALKSRCNLICILGNHDQMMLQCKDSKEKFDWWMECGGITCLDSYGDSGRPNLIPKAHFEFLRNCVSYFEGDTHLFVHANYRPDQPLAETDDHSLRWLSLRDFVPSPHISGKLAVMGHTPQQEVLDLGHLLCIDTNCCDGGWLTALDVNSKKLWQVDEQGQHR